MDESSKETSGKRQSQEPEAAKGANEKGAGETPANETPANDAAASGETPPEPHAQSNTSDSMLPVVWSPKLGADEVSADEIPQFAADEGVESSGDAAADEAAETAGANGAAWPRPVRFALVAASLAAAAALGSFIGSLSADGVVHLWPAAANSAVAGRNAPAAARPETADLSALKGNLDAASRGASGQLAKLAERLDRLERAQAEPAAKLARIAEALDRLEKKNAMTAASAAAAAPETTGTIPNIAPATAEAKLAEKVLQDWIVQDVRAGRALIENRQGGMFDVTTGSVLPGLGRIETIKRQDGQWIVVTAHGMIYSAP
ncbi:MAG: hypothetical protein ACLP19_03970 [Xanthobacteraceae bacterium]